VFRKQKAAWRPRRLWGRKKAWLFSEASNHYAHSPCRT